MLSVGAAHQQAVHAVRARALRGGYAEAAKQQFNKTILDDSGAGDSTL